MQTGSLSLCNLALLAILGICGKLSYNLPNECLEASKLLMPKRRAKSRNSGVELPILPQQPQLSEVLGATSASSVIKRESTSINGQSAPAVRRSRQQNAPRPVNSASVLQKDEHGLREMARRHISYEIKMLRELAAGLQGKGVGPRTMRNALLESFLVHYRNLYDFFYPEFPSRRRLPHDVSASDYLPDRKRWRKKRPEMDPEKSAENRERVNCLLAHLTLRRLKYKNRSWPDRKMAGLIESLIEEFVKELPRARRAWFRSVIAKTPEVKEMQQSSQPAAMPLPKRRAA